MSVDLEQVKKLRQMTGVGITDAKKALEDANGDFDKAAEAMRVKGLAKADKKAGRDAKAGIIDTYVHSERIGVLVELNCETDFVARTKDFKTLAHNIALHVAASDPLYLDQTSVPKADLEKETNLFKEELKNEGKPADMLDKIVEGKIKKWYQEVCLLDQDYVKDADKSVEDLIKESVAKLGENIKIGSYSRLELGQN